MGGEERKQDARPLVQFMKGNENRQENDLRESDKGERDRDRGEREGEKNVRESEKKGERVGKG